MLPFLDEILTLRRQEQGRERKKFQTGNQDLVHAFCGVLCTLTGHLHALEFIKQELPVPEISKTQKKPSA